MDKSDLHMRELFACNACTHGNLQVDELFLLFASHLNKMDSTHAHTQSLTHSLTFTLSKAIKNT